ncbi:MAG: hypothetical protein WCZ90_01950 [Melioribacteraceae bacterium]
MILLLIEISFLFAFVAVLLFFARKKDFRVYQYVFDYYTRLGVLLTLGLLLLNSFVLLDFSGKLQFLAVVAMVIDILSPFWVPLFFYLINKKVDNIKLRHSFKMLSIIGTSVVMGIYTFLLGGLII